MIGLPSGTRVWIAAGNTDMRRGFNVLAALMQTALAPTLAAATSSPSAASAVTSSRCSGGTASDCAL